MAYNLFEEGRGGFNFQCWNSTPYIMINFTSHDLKVNTGEMAYNKIYEGRVSIFNVDIWPQYI